jgi:Tol biopolymer transport system component
MSGLVRITDLDGTILRTFKAAGEPVFAPRGRLLAFVHYTQTRPSTSPVRSMYVVAAPEGRQRRLARGSFATWSPDGRRIAFVRSSPVRTQLYVIGVDGKGLRLVVAERNPIIGRPAWGADGRI